METVKIEVTSAEAASRLELLVRFLWCIVLGLVLGLVGMIAAPAYVVQWLHILVLGSRHSGIQRFINAYMIAKTRMELYWMLATDERPPAIPDF